MLKSNREFLSFFRNNNPNTKNLKKLQCEFRILILAGSDRLSRDITRCTKLSQRFNVGLSSQFVDIFTVIMISKYVALVQTPMLVRKFSVNIDSECRRRNFERILIGKASSPPGVARDILFDAYGRGRVYVNVILCGGYGAEITTKSRQINRFCIRM